jgi:hypothetical protein
LGSGGGEEEGGCEQFHEMFKLIYDLYLFNSIGRPKFRLGHIFIIKYEVCVILGIIGPFRVVDRVVAVVPPPNQR